MMRNLGILIVLSVAALAQTPTAGQNPAQPAPVSVKPATTQAAQGGKPSPSGAKMSAASVAATKKKAVSVQAKSSAARTAGSTSQTKAVSVKAAAAPKTAPPAAQTKTVSVQTAAAGKTAASAPSTIAAGKPGNSSPKATPAAKTATVPSASAKPAGAEVSKTASQAHAVSVKTGGATAKPTVKGVEAKAVTVKALTAKSVTAKPVARAHAKVVRAKPVVSAVAGAKPSPSVQEGKATENKQASQEIHTAGRRDPFVSPVVAMGISGSGCSAGKRCLTIDQIALKGVVKSEAGMIAVVVNAMDKAYFLRENDPVFNGYVVKITGDSIIFKETFHDRLGKTLTRDVTKTITRPVA
jgi:Tfp pilus assembly protein PilP